MPTKYNVLYLTPAQNDFEDIVKFHILESGITSAREIATIMENTIRKLEDFALMGQIHPDPILASDGFRKLVLTKTYVAIYKVIDDTVYIYRIVNARTNYPALLK